MGLPVKRVRVHVGRIETASVAPETVRGELTSKRQQRSKGYSGEGIRLLNLKACLQLFTSSNMAMLLSLPISITDWVPRFKYLSLWRTFLVENTATPVIFFIMATPDYIPQPVLEGSLFLACFLKPCCSYIYFFELWYVSVLSYIFLVIGNEKWTFIYSYCPFSFKTKSIQICQFFVYVLKFCVCCIFCIY